MDRQTQREKDTETERAQITKDGKKKRDSERWGKGEGGSGLERERTRE